MTFLYITEKCQTISNPVNGLINYSTDGVYTVAVIQCGIGYSLAGESTLSCLRDGRWNNPVPSCGKSVTLSTIYRCVSPSHS